MYRNFSAEIGALRAFLPPPSIDLSSGAIELWPAYRGDTCSTCGAFLRGIAPEGPPAPCPDCPARRDYDAAVSLFVYQGHVREGIHAAKYGGRSEAAAAIASRLHGAIDGIWADRIPAGFRPSIVPVPIHPRKYFRRGFNFPAMVAHALSRLTGWPCEPLLLRRTRESLPQAGLPLSAREANVRAAFAASPGATLPADLLLLDDVFTSGATAASCSRALKNAGAAHIVVVTIARAVP